MGRLDGKVAVVTGGGNGIGRASAQRFAEEGAAVLVADVLDEPAAATVESILQARDGARAVAAHLDAADPASNDAVMDYAVSELGGVDVVVTAAGISRSGYRSGDVEGDLRRLADSGPLAVNPAQRFIADSMDDWREVLDVNLTGTYLALRAAARQMVAQGRGGSIITIASIAAKHPEAGPLAYSVSKAGVWMLTKLAARALGPSRIRVNAIGPGFIETNMTAVLQQIPGLVDTVVASLPLGRIGAPREVADAALFLASEESSYFTGELLHPDGGFFTD